MDLSSLRCVAASPPAAEDRLAAARAGSLQALGQLFEGFRRYLLLVANQALAADLQAKAGPSDLVQETFLQAQKNLAGFAGHTERDFLAWLHGILMNNVAALNRHYHGTRKRQVCREVPLPAKDATIDWSWPLPARAESPSWQASAKEEAESVQRALQHLPEQYLQVILMRNRDGCSFAAIGERMNRSENAARMLWVRAFKQLVQEMKGGHGEP